jgi:two-component system, OmpR family, response regulator
LLGPGNRAIRALVVDDEQTLAELLAPALRFEGCDIRIAVDGLSAVTAAREFRPDLMILDVMLPDMHGMEVLRRVRAEFDSVPMLFLNSHEVCRGGDLIGLTATEFELLRYLMRNARRVLSKSQILDRVWNDDFGGQANIVELYISYLRKKFDAGRAPMIHTVRGFGYVIKPAA